MKMGLYGGTFNPIHLAHLIIAECVHESLALDRLLFIPCAVPPLKPPHGLVQGEHRLEMIRLAILDNPVFRVSDLEIERGGKSYTIDTVRSVAAEFKLKREELFLIIGADNLNTIHTWREPEAINKLCRFVAVQRPQHPLRASAADYLSDLILVDAPHMAISSSEIRRRLAAGKSVRYMIPDGVLDYISRHRLYKESNGHA